MKKRAYIIAAALCVAAVVAGFIIAANRPPEIRNIILISIDTCRADHLSCYGYPRETTPHIDAFAQHATRFENVTSPIPETFPAHSSMLTGTIPPFHGVHRNIGYQLAPSNLTLQEILKKNGFNTSAIISAFVLDRKVGLAQGFDTYYDIFKEVHQNQLYNERKGDETTQLALDWLEENKFNYNRSFLFLHYYDPHDEYAPPEPYATDFADNLYAGEIAFTDHCIGRIIEKLKELKMYDSALLIITGDHGEMLGEHGEEEHTYFIYESAIKVPLIIKLPGQKKGTVVTQPVGLVDITPTVCSLLDLDIPSRIQGQDVSMLLKGGVPETYERFLYSESIAPTRLGASSLMSISAGKWKYIQAPRPELYNLSSDPGETYNLIEKEVHRGRILEDKLREKLEQSIRKDQDNRIQLDAESIRRLESLGYVAGNTKGEIVFDKNKDDPKDLIHVFSQYQKAVKLMKYKEYKKAKKILIDLIPHRPGFYEIYMQLGDIGACLGDFDLSVENNRRAFKLNPTQPMILNNLAWVQATRPSLASRDLDEAVMCARKLCEQSNFSNPHTLDTLAVVYAARGDYPQAIETAQKAHKLASAANETEFAHTLAERLKLFKDSKPYVDEAPVESFKFSH